MKQTSDRVSRIAARLMRRVQFRRKEFHVRLDEAVSHVTGITYGDVLTLAASVLSQDETRGPRRRKKARR